MKLAILIAVVGIVLITWSQPLPPRNTRSTVTSITNLYTNSVKGIEWKMPASGHFAIYESTNFVDWFFVVSINAPELEETVIEIEADTNMPVAFFKRVLIK